jgi:hypothetical protein
MTTTTRKQEKSWETAQELIEAVVVRVPVTEPVADTGAVSRPPVHPTSDDMCNEQSEPDNAKEK